MNFLEKKKMEIDVERTRQTLSFVEQLQNQIQLCREALSGEIYRGDLATISNKLSVLETLLWAKIKDDKEYNETIKKIKKSNSEQEQLKYLIKKFKAIMIFIDKKGYMPIGED